MVGYRGDLIGAHAHVVPDGHVFDGDAVTIDTWAAAAGAGSADDAHAMGKAVGEFGSLCRYWFHIAIVT